jgi:oligopeptide transport system substrate-binding protein
MWKKLGVNVEFVNMEAKVNFANVRQGNFEVALGYWFADYNDAQDFLFQQQTSTKELNSARFSNPDYDRLMDAASVTGDQSKRAQLLQQAEQVLLQEMPILPIYFGVTRNLVSTRVKGWEDNLLNITYVKNLSLEK